MENNGTWVTILEYAQIRKISISTIRRSIKANLIKYKEENGRYLIWSQVKVKGNCDSSEIEELKLKNKKLEEEIQDLKMLLAVYEDKNQPPPISLQMQQ